MPYASIIICTRNRAASLAMTLDSLDVAIRLVPDVSAEVILVDNGSSDDTQQVVKAWADSVSFTVKTLIEPRKGLSHARNTGVAAASGEVLVFTDDDCTLSADYLRFLKQRYSRDVVPTLRGGKVELGTTDDLPFSIKLDETVHSMGALDYPGGFIIGANMTMHRDVVAKIGLFDVRFGAGARFIAGEDTDYIYRCYLQGVPVEYVPDMVVKHFHGRRDVASIVQLNHGYHVGGGALYAKYIFRWGLVRHLYWDFKKWLHEIMGGKRLDGVLNLSYGALMKGTVRGMFLYWSDVVFVALGRKQP